MEKTENTSKDEDQSQHETKKQHEVKPRKRLSEAEKLAMDEGVQRIFLEFVGKKTESTSSNNSRKKNPNEGFKRQQQQQTPPSKKKKARNEVERLRGDEGAQRMLQDVYDELRESREEKKKQSKRIANKAELSALAENATTSSEAEVSNMKSKKKDESLKSKHTDDNKSEEEQKEEIEKRPDSGQIREKDNADASASGSSAEKYDRLCKSSNALEKTQPSVLVESSSPIAPVSIGIAPKIQEEAVMATTTTSTAKYGDAHCKNDESRERTPLPKLLTVSSSAASVRNGIHSKAASDRAAKIVGAKPIGQAVKQPMYVPSEEVRSSIDEDLLHEVYGDMELKDSLLRSPVEEKEKNMHQTHRFPDTLKRKIEKTKQEDSLLEHEPEEKKHKNHRHDQNDTVTRQQAKTSQEFSLLKHHSKEKEKEVRQPHHLNCEIERKQNRRIPDVAESNKFNKFSLKESHHRISSSSGHFSTHNAKLEPRGRDDQRQGTHKEGQLLGSTSSKNEHSARFSDNSMANYVRSANPSNLRTGGNHRSHPIDFPSSAPSFNDVIQSHKSVEARRFHRDSKRNEGEAFGSQDQSKHLRHVIPQAHNSSVSPHPDRTWHNLQDTLVERPSIGVRSRDDFTTSSNKPIDRPLKSILKRPSNDAEVEKQKQSEHASTTTIESMNLRKGVRPQSFPNPHPSAQNFAAGHDSVFKSSAILDLAAPHGASSQNIGESTLSTMNVSSAHDSVQSVVKSEDLTNKGSNKQDNSSQPSTDGEQEILIPNMVPRAPGIKELQGEFKTTYEQDARTLTVGAWLHVTDEERRKHFERYGTIEDVRTIRYVTMIRYSTIEEMQQAVLIHNQNKVVGRFGGVTTFLTRP